MAINTFKPLPLLNSYIDQWAVQTPDVEAMIEFMTDRKLTYREFQEWVDLYALRLLDLGIAKGDRVASMLFTTQEHFILMYACFKVGAIMAPIDMRLKETEVVRDLEKIKPRAMFFPGDSDVREFSLVGRTLKKEAPYIEFLIEVPQVPATAPSSPDFLLATELFSFDTLQTLRDKPGLIQRLDEIYKTLKPLDPCIIIFTTGTTGAPKPAVLNHRVIIASNEILARIFGLKSNEWRLINPLPPSHIAGTTEIPFTSFYVGGTVVLMNLFNPVEMLEAIQRYKITAIATVPTMYRYMWMEPNYKDYDISSLKFVLYAGAAVDVPFLEGLSSMAPRFATGIGMTENAGFATGTPSGISVEEMMGQVGRSFPDVAEVTIRQPMNENGTAGEELPDGEIGEICYHPPLVFSGYFGNHEETAKTISKEGILYTGDMGYFKDMGTYRGLYLGGRRKFMIKQKGYNVFPDEVQAYLTLYSGVQQVEVVGVPHRLFDEGIFAFVQPKPGVDLTADELLTHTKGIASYKRPQHVQIWPSDRPFPVNRLGKVNKQELQKIAKEIAGELKAVGQWDAEADKLNG